MKRALALLAVLTLALVLAACGGGDDDTATSEARPAAGGQPVRIGAKNFTEQLILGELYRQALEAKGFEVVLKANVGSTEIIHRALRRGALDMYPEYVGVLLSEVAEVLSRPRSAAAAYELAKEYEEKGGFTLLAQTPGADSNALAVMAKFAERHNLRTIADLRHLEGTVRVGALPEFRTRHEGLEGLREVYGLRNLRVSAMDSEDRYPALRRGLVDVASVFTTEAQLADSAYVVLEDPRGLFASGHVAPIVSKEILEAHGSRLQEAIDAVSKLLTTTAMRDLNAAVDLRGREPAAVADEFLRAQGLV